MILSPVYNTGNKTVETDLGTYGNNVIANALDGNINTKFYSSAGATVGSYVRVDLGKEIPLYDTAIYYAGNPKGPAHGIDGFAATKMEISTDGVSWTQIGDIIKDENYQSKTVEGQLVSEAAFNADGQMARYIRFSATESSDNWVQVFEIPFNKTVDNLGDDSIDIIDTTITTGNVSNLYDRDLTSAFAPDSVVDEDTLTYAMTSITNVGRLMIMQDPTAICNATVSVKDVEGNWSDIGTLDKGTNTFDVNKTILEVKLTFHANNPTPSIYEIIASQKEVEEVNKTALKVAVDKANAVTDEALINVIPVVVEEFKAARDEANVIYNNENATQTEVDNAVARLIEVMQKLEFYKGDKTTLKIALDLATTITDEDLANVVPVVVEEFKAALQQAKDVYDNVNATQADVNNAFDRLAEAMHMLNFVKGDKTALKAFIDKVSGLEAVKYTEATWTPFNEALTAATSVYEDVNAMQEEVNNAYNELVTAFLNLRLIPNKDLLGDLINQAEGLESANYTKATFDGLTKALNEAKVVFDNPNATQKEVDNAKDVLAKAMADLQTVTVDNTVKTPVSNGDTTASVKTGDDVNMLGTLGLISSLGVIAFLKKKKRN